MLKALTSVKPLSSDQSWARVRQQTAVVPAVRSIVRQQTGRISTVAKSAGFHEARLAAAPRRSPKSLRLDIVVR